MFKDIIPKVPKLIHDATKYLIEQDDFKEINKSIIDYCIENNVLISDIRFLMKEPLIFKPYNLYTDNLMKLALGLANFIHKNNGKLVKTKTVIYGEIISVEFDTYVVCNINYLERIKEFPIDSIIFPIRHEKIAYFPPEIELIDIYRGLYSPHRTGDWDNFMYAQRILFKPMIERLVSIHSTSVHTLKSAKSTTGGEIPLKPPSDGASSLKLPLLNDETNPLDQSLGETISSELTLELTLGGSEGCKSCKEKRQKFADKLKMHVLDVIAQKYVLIGTYGVSKLADMEIHLHDMNIIQVISENNIKDDALFITNVLSKITDYKITYDEQNLHIPKDLITKRYRFFINYPSIDKKKSKKAFLDIFNSAQFELIPYVISGPVQKIGNPFVIIRFMLIDLWIYKIIRERGLIDKNKADRKMTELIKYIYIIIGNKFSKYLFGLDHYGIFKDPDIMQKIKKSQSKKYEYYPELYYRQHGEYRTLTSTFSPQQSR